MDVTMWKAQIRVAAASGFVQVRRQGETSDRIVACARHLSTAQVNEWVQIIEAEGQPLAVALLGVAPTPVPPNPDPTPPTPPAPPTITVPVAWSGTLKWTPYNGDTPAGFHAGEDGFNFGRNSSDFWGNRREEGLAIYSGLRGLNITAATVEFSPYYLSNTTPDANTRLALWLAPETRPADQSPTHPSEISRIADQPLGVVWPPPGSATVNLPPAWIDHLRAGTANGVGLINNTAAPTSGIWTYGAIASPMTITYQ